MMSLSFSRRRIVKCFGSYHDDFCILSVPWLCWLKQKSWLGIKCYYSRANIVSKEVGSLDQCCFMFMKYLYQSFGQLVVHMLSLRQVVQITSFVKKREYSFFLIIEKTKEKICEFHLGCCVCILPISLPGKKMLVFFPN